MPIIEVQTLASGQPRPYADHRLHVRVMVTDNDDNESDVRSLLLKHGGTGFIETKKEDRGDLFDSYLGRLERVAPGVWEFVKITPFTD